MRESKTKELELELRKVRGRHAVDQRKLKRLLSRFDEMKAANVAEVAHLSGKLERLRESKRESDAIIDHLTQEQSLCLAQIERIEVLQRTQEEHHAALLSELEAQRDEAQRLYEDQLEELQDLRELLRYSQEEVRKLQTIRGVLEEKVTSQSKELFETRGKLMKYQLQQDASDMLKVGLSKAERKLRGKDTRIQELESRVLELMRESYNSGHGTIKVGAPTMLGRATQKLSGWFGTGIRN